MRERTSDSLDRARALVEAYGWNAMTFQTINPGIAHWFSAAGDALVGYADWAGVRVVAGAPIAATDRLPAVIADFERDARAAHLEVCYFGAGERLDRLLAERGPRARLLLGAQPAWEPAHLVSTIERRSTLRAQLHRARNKGVAVTEWSPPLDEARQAALAGILAAWLRTRGLPPLHFLVEPNILDRLDGRRVFVAERGLDIVGFLVASPVPQRHGWLIEQLIRGPRAPNGTNELLLFAAAERMAAAGDRYITLGLAPLSRRSGISAPPAPAWTRALLAWIRAHGRRFYNFDGLDAFKAKFLPEHWEPIYAVATGPTISPRVLYAIAGVFSGQSPLLTVAAALARAVRREAMWLAKRRG